MADLDFARAFKDLPIKIQTASIKERRETVQDVIAVLSNPDITENIVRGICKILQITVPRYRDRKSQIIIKNLVLTLVKQHPKWCIKNLTPVLSDIAMQLKGVSPTKYTSQTGLFVLSWSCLLMSFGFDNNGTVDMNAEFQQLVESQSVLLTVIVAAGNKRYSLKAQKALSSVWSQKADSELNVLKIIEATEPSQHTVVLGAAICRALATGDRQKLVKDYKAKLLEIFIKTLVSCKTKPRPTVIEACYPLLKLVSEEEFTTSLLPALQKAMLRNPEIILECVGLVISGLKLDLSKYAADIGKSLVTNLHSKDDVVRQESSEAFRRLAGQCTEVKAIETLLSQIFNVFHGSDGKLTVLEHKLDVLKGAGYISENGVTGSDVQNLTVVAAEHFFKVLETEVNETCLCYALELLSRWCKKFTKEVPQKVIDGIKKGIGLKTSTPLVRTGYIVCMLSCFTRDNVKQCIDLIPVLLKSVERSVAQPSQAGPVGEGICAARMLLRIVAFDTNVNGKLQPLWNVVFDMEKQVFVSDKYLSLASNDVLYHLMHLCSTLLQNYGSKLTGREGPLYKAIIHSAVSTTGDVRRDNLKQIEALVSKSGPAGAGHAKAMMAELAQYMQTAKSAQNGTRDDSKDGELNSHAVIECLKSLMPRVDFKAKDVQQLAFLALPPAHHPAIVSVAPDLWSKLLKIAKQEPRKLIGLSIKQFQSFVDNFVASPCNENAMATLVSIGPDFILPYIVQTVETRLRQPALLEITKDDYFIFLTPDGELYDKSVVPGNEEDELNARNLKRESKAYSYKEQLEELALRRELQEKKRREGKITEPQFTQKQLEAIKAQQDKEAAIRERLRGLNTMLINTVSIVRAASKATDSRLCLHFKELIPAVLSSLQSPLAAPYLTSLFVDLHETVFPKDLCILGELIAYVTLRLLKPACDLNSAWEEEDLGSAVTRTITLIHDKTVKSKDKSLRIDIPQMHFTAPIFCYMFPLLKLSLLSSYARENDNLIHDGLQIISDHARIRSQYQSNTKTDLFHPNLLPRKQMFELLVELIDTTMSRIQTQAVACLLDVATSGSGGDRCARASSKELEVLLSALQSPCDAVRDAALRALLTMSSAIPTAKEDPELFKTITKRVWVSKFDINQDIRELADALWTKANLEVTANLSDVLMADIQHPVESIQQAVARALHALLEPQAIADPKVIQKTLNRLLDVYHNKLTLIPPQLDNFGRVIEQPIDMWGPRRGIALALAQLAPLLSTESIGKLITFFVQHGLGDRNEVVRKEMLAAALQVVELHGKDTVSTVLPVFEKFMDKAPKSGSFDAVRQSVVILMGSLARHLDKDDERIKPIVMRLISALSTPSQQVQESVANCLPHLVPSIKDDAPNIVNKLLHQLLKSEKYGDRRGAAYGIAGLVKGMGILALKQLDIMTKLTEAIQDKKNYKHREGALFAFEILCQMLGRLFEPYIVHVLPHLLLCFGDTSQYVRTATDDTARVVMSKLSAHGVKLVLPSLLAALEEDSWRTKTGSVELLGSMAYCAPKQLSSCLPSIVPKLIEVLSDSHMKVQAAGAEALRVIGSVIRNPEIQAIVPVLLQALQDPSNKTSACLQTLLDTQFVHFIDAPSLALIMPVVQRAFQDRSTETRKMAAQIIGNMYSLTDQKDLKPYLPTIIPGLKTSLLDPVPEVRSVSARALGAMVRGMGEASFEDLLPWLMQTLTSESSSVDRSGAAQGLSEVVAGLGVEKLHKLMPEIIATAERTDIAPHVKDGYIMMFIYMPVAFTAEFTPYIGQIINPILQALADENEYVRDTALKAGQRIVNLYADTAIMLLLPELEKGLFDDNWRIRYSSVQLLGDLLYRISGVSGKMSTETASEDDNFGTEQSHQAIIRALGAERRNRVLAGLYMGRSDVALMVRQAALHVWKVVVTNTPRTLREILPTLFALLLGCLASTSYDKRQVAARTLGDLVRKLGERVLPEIIPILEDGLQSDQADTRQGVCIGLSEIMASTSRDMVLTFVNSLVPTVRKALCDPLSEVRQAAAKTFDSLHSTVGVKALDDILPAMLNQLNNEDPEVVECTLDGLRQVMAIKSRVVLPYLIPQLSAPPVNTKALAILASVAGEALTRFLPKILPALLTALSDSHGTADEAQQLEYCQTVVLSVTDDTGTRTIIDQLLEHTRADCPLRRRSAAALLCAFCGSSKADFSSHIPQLLRGLIYLCIDDDRDVLLMAWEALNAVTKTIDPKQQAMYVADVRQAVRFAASDLKGSGVLPGFCLPKGITPILPIFREAILNGDGDEKEAAAQGLGEVISVTSAPALQPSVVTITGPLIRILGDRFSWQVKAAVLETLAILLNKVGVMLKQFLPQLQTTFLKALHDPTRQVRLRAALALSQLITIHARCDPLFADLHSGVKNAEDSAVRETMLQALRGVITAAGDKMSETLRKQVLATLIGLLSHQEDISRSAAAGCLGALTKYLSPEQLNATLNDHILCEDPAAIWQLRHGRSTALTIALKEASDVIYTPEREAAIIKTLLARLTSDKVPVALSAVRGCGYLLKHLLLEEKPLPHQLLVPFVRTMNHNSNDVKQLLARVATHLAKLVPPEKMAPELLRLLLPTLVNGTKEKNGYVKANSEIALITVLRLRQGDDTHQRCMQLLEAGAKESLSDVVSKVLRKVMCQPEGKEEELDDTLIA